MTNRKFTCENCRIEFEAGWSEEESLAEKDYLFPGIPEDQMVIVCDGCFVKIMDYNEPGQNRYNDINQFVEIKYE